MALLLPWLGEGAAAPREFSSPIVLKAGHTSNVDEPYHLGLLEFARIVEARSAGAVRVDVYPAGQLGSERMMIEGLRLGTLDIAVTANGSASSFVPELRMLDLPFLFRDRAHMYRVLDGGVGASLRDHAARRGFRLLGYMDAGVRHIMTRSRPLETFDDLRGLKIRTMPVPWHLEAFAAFGAQAVALNYGEVYGSLQTGLIDGAEAANTNFTRKKFYEVAPNWAQIGWIILVANMMMAEDTFQALPSEIQGLLRDAGAVATELERRLYQRSDEALLAEIEALGVRVTHPDPRPFRAAAKALYEALVRGPREKRLLERILDEGSP